jgi:SMC interacting uncharacterized protein involved in chromosome segregation
MSQASLIQVMKALRSCFFGEQQQKQIGAMSHCWSQLVGEAI